MTDLDIVKGTSHLPGEPGRTQSQVSPSASSLSTATSVIFPVHLTALH